MDMKICPNNHVYDASVNESCPHCGHSSKLGSTRPIGVDAAGNETIPLDATRPMSDYSNVTIPMSDSAASVGATVPIDSHISPGAPVPEEHVYTIPVPEQEHGFLPPFGWLVCTSGTAMGADYTLKGEICSIGRDATKSKIVIDDPCVSGVAASIIYDKNTGKYHVRTESTTNNIYLNDSIILSVQEINDRDMLKIGGCKFMFVALCGEWFRW